MGYKQMTKSRGQLSNLCLPGKWPINGVWGGEWRGIF